MVAHLTDIPEELIDNICQFLAVKDVSRFRLTCTNIRGKSYHAWATSSFQKMEFMITRNSLQHLIDFSKHKKFGPCIRELGIHTVCISELSKDKWLEWARGKDMIKRSGMRAYGRLADDQNTLRKQSIDVSMLVEAMRNLPNLEAITVHGNSSLSRVWGVKEFRKMTGIYLLSASTPWQREHWFDEMHAHVFATVLSAIATSGVKLRELRIWPPVAMPSMLPATPNGRSHSFTPRQTISEAHIELLKPAFSRLKTLDLAAISWEDDPEELMWVTRLLSLCPGLEVFHLTALDNSAQFIGRISQFQLLPKIRDLVFSKIVFSPSHLINLLINHASTLERFRLAWSRMEEGSYTDILRALQSLPHLNFVDFNFNSIPAWCETGLQYKWYYADAFYTEYLTLGAENGQKMAEKLEMVITRQLRLERRKKH